MFPGKKEHGLFCGSAPGPFLEMSEGIKQPLEMSEGIHLFLEAS